MPRTQAFYVHKALKVIVICKHKDFIFIYLLVIFSYLKSLNNSQKFIVIGLIPSCSRNYLSKKKSH